MRTATPVDKKLMIEAVRRAESDGPLGNHNALWTAAADIYNAFAGIPKTVSFSVVSSRMKEWGLVDGLKTKAGKRGVQGPMTEERKAAMQAARVAGGGRRPRAEKLAVFAKDFEDLRAVTPVQFHGDIEKMIGGSMSTAVRRKCMDCSENKSLDVRLCTVGGTCPLFFFRPHAIPSSEVRVLIRKREKQEAKEDLKEDRKSAA
jgi:hypothetical protein